MSHLSRKNLIHGSSFKVGLSTFKKRCFVFFNESPLKMMKYAFYFILEALFILKIFKFLSCANATKWSNTLKQFVGNSGRLVWMCLTIMWGCRIKSYEVYWIQLVVSVTELKYAKNIKPRGGIEDLNKEYDRTFLWKY